MSFISITGENSITDVLNLSECHYLLSRNDLSCHKVEFIVRPVEDTNKLIVLLHGIVLKHDRFKKLIEKRRSPYHKLFNIGQVFSRISRDNVVASRSSGIIDCGQTLKEGESLVTNKGYEGVPQFMRNIQYDASNDTCTIYGVDDIVVPKCRFDVDPIRTFSKVVITRESSTAFEKDKLYAFRIIFFLKITEADIGFGEKAARWAWRFSTILITGKKEPYNIHLFALPTGFRECCGSTSDLKEELLRDSKLFLNTSIFMTFESLRKKLRDALAAPESNLTKSKIEEESTKPTSDIWVFTDQYTTIGIRGIRRGAEPELENPEYLMFMPRKERRLNIKRYHVQIARDFSATDLQFITPQDFNQIQVEVDFGLPRLMGLFTAGRMGLLIGIFAAAFTISFARNTTLIGTTMTAVNNSLWVGIISVIGFIFLFTFGKLLWKFFMRQKF